MWYGGQTTHTTIISILKIKSMVCQEIDNYGPKTKDGSREPSFLLELVLER
jgi:hypothetical protein